MFVLAVFKSGYKVLDQNKVEDKLCKKKKIKVSMFTFLQLHLEKCHIHLYSAP